jgi:hypothetical protein
VQIRLGTARLTLGPRLNNEESHNWGRVLLLSWLPALGRSF